MGGNTSGWTLLGERGPELVNLPAGSSVTNTAQLRAGLANGGGVTANYYLTVQTAPGTPNAEVGRILTEHLIAFQKSNGPGALVANAA